MEPVGDGESELNSTGDDRGVESASDSGGATIDELIRRYEEDPEFRSQAERQSRELQAKLAKCGIVGPFGDLGNKIKDLWLPFSESPIDGGLSDTIRELSRLTTSIQAAKVGGPLAFITEQQRHWDSIMQPMRQLASLTAPIREMEKATRFVREFSMPELPKPEIAIDPVVFRDHRLEAELETKRVVEELRDATLELIGKQDTQIEHLQDVNRNLTLAHDRAERALVEEKASGEEARADAQREKVVSQAYNHRMMLVTVGSVAIAFASMMVAVVAWLYPRPAPDAKATSPTMKVVRPAAVSTSSKKLR